MASSAASVMSTQKPWFDKDLGQWVNDPVLEEQISVESGETRSPSNPDWTPVQAGTHRITVECEAADQSILIHEVDVNIGLGLVELDSGFFLDHANSVGDGLITAELLDDDVQRVNLFAKASAVNNVIDPNVGVFDQTYIAGGMYKTFVVEDGSNTTDDWWDIDLIFDGKFAGIIDAMAWGVTPNLWEYK